MATNQALSTKKTQPSSASNQLAANAPFKKDDPPPLSKNLDSGAQ